MEKNNLNIRSTAVPANQLSQNDWMQEFRAGSAYIKPTNYYTGNHFQPVTNDSIINRIIRFLNNII